MVDGVLDDFAKLFKGVVLAEVCTKLLLYEDKTPVVLVG